MLEMLEESTSFQGLRMDGRLKKIVDEELESAKERIWTRIKRIGKSGNRTSARRRMKLQFRNKISKQVLTGEEIRGEGDTFMEVALVDSTGNVVDAEPEASASAEIVLLKGNPEASEGDDWTAEEFDENIVKEKEGKKPLLAENVPLKLRRGLGVMKNIKFRHHACKIRPSVFRLGARVVETIDRDRIKEARDRIKEAKTESFTVKDFRCKYYKKHETPSLTDEVSRLVNIHKGGKIDKRLQDKQIHTVEDFLVRLLIDPEGLKRIVNSMGKKWRNMVNNARACSSEGRVYCYTNFQQHKGIVFNILGEVLRLYLENQFAPMNMSEIHEGDAQELLASAYKHWEHVKPFDDENSLREYFSRLSNYQVQLDCPKPDFPGGGHVNTEACEMVGESSSRLNFSLQRISSAINSTRETGVEEINSFTIDDVEIVEDAPFQRSTSSPFYPETMLSDFDDFLRQNEAHNRQFNSPMNELDAGEQTTAITVTFTESQVVHNRWPPKRWKKLLSVSRWFSIRKRICRRYS